MCTLPNAQPDLADHAWNWPVRARGQGLLLPSPLHLLKE